MVQLPVNVMDLNNRRALPQESYAPRSASGDDFGAQTGQALTQFASAGLELAGRIKANEIQVQRFGYEDAFIKLQDAENTAYEQSVRGLSGPAEGFWQSTREKTKKTLDDWVNTLPPAQQPEYRVKADRYLAGRTQQAFGDQYKQQDANTRLVIADTTRQAGLQVQQNPATYEQFVQQQVDLIDKSTLTPIEKEQRKAEIKNGLAYTAEMSRAQSDPASVARRGAPSFSPEVNTAIDDAARANGLDPGVMRRFAQIESSGNPAAKTGSYQGLFQLSDGEFSKYGSGNIYSARDNANAAAKKLAAESAEFQQKTGRPATATDLYLIHQQGMAGYTAHLKNPQAPAWQNMLSTGEGQQKGERWAKAAIWGNIPDNIKARFPGGVDTVTSAAFTELWRSKVDGTAAPTVASAALTPQQDAAVQEAAVRAQARMDANAAAQAKATRDAALNSTYVELKEGPAPDATYLAARRSGLLTDYDDIKKAEGIMTERAKGADDLLTGINLMSGNYAANPFEKTHRDGATAFYNQRIAGGANPAQTAADVFDRTGIVPQPFATALRGAMVSNDATTVAAGLQTAANMTRQNPNAFAGVDGRSDLENGATEFRRLTETLGLSAEQATQKIMADARQSPELKAVKQDEMAAFRKEYLSQSAIDSRLSGNFSSWNPFSDKPFSVTLPVGPQRTAMSSIYGEFATEGFEKFKDPSKALAYADNKVAQQFGTMNGVLMRYPPGKANLPKLQGSGSDGYAWIAEQAAQMMQDQLGVVVKPSQIALLPVERDGVSTRQAFTGQPMTVTRNDSKPGQQTQFQSVPYMIVVTPETAEQDVLTLNGAFFPDAESYAAKKGVAGPAAAARANRQRVEDTLRQGQEVERAKQSLGVDIRTPLGVLSPGEAGALP